MADSVPSVAALLEQKRRLETLMGNVPGMVYRCRNAPQRTMEFVSQGCRALCEVAPEQFLGNAELSYADLIHPSDRSMVWDQVQHAIEQRESFVLEYRLRLPSGTIKWVWERGGGVFDGDDRPLAIEGFITDITERRGLHEQLLHAQKLEAVGRLAGGVAHDFNNNLAAINGYVELLLDSLPEGDVRRQDVLEIKAAGERSARLTHQLLAFSRRQVLHPEVIDINQSIQKLEDMLRRLIGEDIRLLNQMPAGLPPVLMDPGQLEQVIMNLAVNARDAMSDGGELCIQTRSILVGPGFTDQHVPIPAGHYVVLIIRDTGTGMEPSVLKQVFEPFFTTKRKGKGTGLGLSTVYGIVKQSGGFIFADSEVGEGCQFRIYLPAQQATKLTSTDHQEAPQKTEFHAHSACLLLVEDEENLLRLLERVLRAEGYQVLATPSPEQALQIFAREGDRIDLLLTDVIMPQIDGFELSERLRKKKPDLKVLFMSGYTDSVIMNRGLFRPGVQLLQKPFANEQMLARLAEILVRPASADGGRG